MRHERKEVRENEMVAEMGGGGSCMVKEREGQFYYGVVAVSGNGW